MNEDYEVETTRLLPLRPQNYEKVSGSRVVEMEKERPAEFMWRRRTVAKVVVGMKGRSTVEVRQILRIIAEDSRVGEDFREGILHGFCAPHNFMLPASPLGSNSMLTSGA